VLLQRLKHIGDPGFEDSGPSGNDEINAAESDRILAERLADLALDTVTINRAGRDST
jgi:hypothetical protein